MSPKRLFVNRQEAGAELSERLTQYANGNTIILAIPRGGVPVATEVSKKLSAPLDILVVRKLGSPQNPELGIGAIAQGGIVVLDTGAISALGVTKPHIDEVTTAEALEVERRVQAFRGNAHNPHVTGKTVILVDDGLATGVTAVAAVRSLKPAGPKRVIVAVPVTSLEAASLVRPEVDELVTLHETSDFRAVGLWYDDFEQLSDEQVQQLLSETR